MKQSIKTKNLLYGVGVNDADYTVKPTIDGKRVVCPFYRKWTSMLQRVYSFKYHQKYPTYISTTVCKEWLSFMNFKKWMMTQEWEGLHLDKNLLFPNNKHYSPETCVFVSRKMNNLLTDHAAKRGDYPQGVHWNKQNQKFRAEISIHGKIKHLGYYNTASDASQAYTIAKIDHIKTFYPQVDKKIKDGLKRHVKLLQA